MNHMPVDIAQHPHAFCLECGTRATVWLYFGFIEMPVCSLCVAKLRDLLTADSKTTQEKEDESKKRHPTSMFRDSIENRG